MPQFVFSTNCGIFGRGDGDRTHDLSVPNAARYQLRYASSQILFSEIHRRCFFIASTNASIITNTREKVNLFHTKTKNSFYFFFNLFRPNSSFSHPCMFFQNYLIFAKTVNSVRNGETPLPLLIGFTDRSHTASLCNDRGKTATTACARRTIFPKITRLK